MKKTWIALLLVMALTLPMSACGKKEAEPMEAGGWTETKDKELSAEDKEIFAAAVEGTEYEGYEVVSLLGTQVVAGRNYRFLCHIPEGDMILVVYRDLEGNCSVTSAEKQ